MSLTSRLPALSSWLNQHVNMQPVLSQIAHWDTENRVQTSRASDPLLLGLSMLYRHRLQVCGSNPAIMKRSTGGRVAGVKWELDDNRLSVCLALADTVGRGGKARFYPQSTKQAVAEDVANLSTWMPRYRGTLQSINPKFNMSKYVGGADGGFIIDNVLYMVRTSKTGMKPEYLYQNVLYALLDTANYYKLHSVAFVLPRQQSVHYLELASVLGENPLAVRWKLQDYLMAGYADSILRRSGAYDFDDEDDAL